MEQEVEEIPDNEDYDPRSKKCSILRKNSWDVTLFGWALPAFDGELAVVIVLLLMALLFSGLRAAYSAVSALETPWEKKKNISVAPDRASRFVLLLMQRICMLTAFPLLAYKLHFDPDRGFDLFIIYLLVWLLFDAYARLYGSKNAVGITHKTVGVVRPILNVFLPLGAFFQKMAVQLRIISIEQSNDFSDSETVDETIEEEKELLIGVASISQTMVRQAMVGRGDITALDMRMDFHELMDKINKSGFSRIPVYDSDLDRIEGILYVKDLLPHIRQDEHFTWQKLIRKPYLIPETKKLDDLLESFQTKRVHLAVVVDEYGGTCGLITLEDIIEEIFGDISDEYDGVEDHFVERIDSNAYVFEGKALLNDVIRTLNISTDYFDEERRGSETLGGLLLELFERLPKNGEELNFKDLTFVIQSSNKKMIRKIKVVVNVPTEN